MDLSQVSKVMETAPKGANVILEWVRECKVRKGSPQVKKAVRMVGRLGLNYDNLAKVVEKRANGDLPQESAGLPEWSEWVKYPFLIRHKGTGQMYLRLYKGTSDKVKPKRQYILNGKETDPEAVDAYLLASEKKDHEDTDTFMVKVEDLTRVYSETTEYGSLF